MRTHYLGQEEVLAYAKDFVARLQKLGEFPLIWCPIGPSGAALLAIIIDVIPEEIRTKASLVHLDFDRDTHTCTLANQAEAMIFTSKAPVLILDSSVHSGSTMLAAVREVSARGATKVMSYSLVLKQGSTFVPNFFGVIIPNCDRAYMMLPAIPNNRMTPYGVVRKLDATDGRNDKGHLNCGLESLDKTTWATLWYETVAKSSHVYVYEESREILAFISITYRPGKLMFIDGVAVDKRAQGRKGHSVGGCLMRWAETLARSNDYHEMELWAINDRVQFYEHMGFASRGQNLDLGSEKYVLMGRKLLYHLDAQED